MKRNGGSVSMKTVRTHGANLCVTGDLPKKTHSIPIKLSWVENFSKQETKCDD